MQRRIAHHHARTLTIALTAITTIGCDGSATDDVEITRMFQFGNAYDTGYDTGYDTAVATTSGGGSTGGEVSDGSSTTPWDTTPISGGTTWEDSAGTTAGDTTPISGGTTTWDTTPTSGGTTPWDTTPISGGTTTWDTTPSSDGTTWDTTPSSDGTTWDTTPSSDGTTWGDSDWGTGGTTWGETEDPSTGNEPDPSPTSGAEGSDSGGYDTGADDWGDTDGGDTGGGDTSGGDTGGGDDGGGGGGGGGPCKNHWVRAPRATGTAHIEGFNPINAAANLLGQDPWKTAAAVPIVGNDFKIALTALITGLATSANPTPPASFNKNAYGNKWGPWKNSKEYRGYLDLFPYKIYCDSATNKLAKKPGAMAGTTADYHEGASLQMSHGYTKLPLGVFQAGEPHGTTPTVNKMTFGDRKGAKTDQCLTHTGYFAARIGAVERAAAFPILQYDAPFIWQRVESTVCCDGSYEVHFNGSHFPTQSLYLNFDRTRIRWQTNLAQFIISGGVVLNAAGVGLMAAAGAPVNRQGNAKKIDACNGAVTQQYTPNPSINANLLP